mmetsp:Transcript_75421/g.217794  ORF Transcript_75421/g.217794 Transcript_75421/m.217794 type:complete len:272 (-) Transcript_75421:755-1570(-)
MCCCKVVHVASFIDTRLDKCVTCSRSSQTLPRAWSLLSWSERSAAAFAAPIKELCSSSHSSLRWISSNRALPLSGPPSASAHASTAPCVTSPPPSRANGSSSNRDCNSLTRSSNSCSKLLSPGSIVDEAAADASCACARRKSSRSSAAASSAASTASRTRDLKPSRPASMSRRSLACACTISARKPSTSCACMKASNRSESDCRRCAVPSDLTRWLAKEEARSSHCLDNLLSTVSTLRWAASTISSIWPRSKGLSSTWRSMDEAVLNASSS